MWLGFVAVLPWATFFVPVRVAKIDSNLASGLMMAGYLAVCAALSLYLAGGIPEPGWQKAGLVVGWLVAAFYTYVVCEFIASKAEE